MPKNREWLVDEGKARPITVFDDRSDKEDISLLVVHNISLPPGQFGGPHIEEFFKGTLDPNAHPFLR